MCDFRMRVKGASSDIENFYNSLTQKGRVFMGRGAEADIHYDEENEAAEITGWCKWSIRSALIDNAVSMREEPEKWCFPGMDQTALEFITLMEACERWNLDAEVYSEECGFCFQEHYLIRKGNCEIDEEEDWEEYCLDEFDTKEEAEEELELSFSDEEWESRYASRGGFDEWCFVI